MNQVFMGFFALDVNFSFELPKLFSFFFLFECYHI